MKVTAIAPSNIAFIKYWGKKDERLRLPANASISMNLSHLKTTTTVEFLSKYKEDEVIINEEKEEKQQLRVVKHLDRIRKLARLNFKAKVVSKSNFPISTGLSSSASGFAALTLAASKAAGLNLSEKKLSILARQASGSACRSIPDGFVEWLDGTNETSYAVSLFPPDWWSIADVVVIVSQEKKEVSSTEGQKLAKTSPFFPERLKRIKRKTTLLKKWLKEKNFPKFGQLIEEEALELHAIMLTSTPSLIYWQPGTITLMKLVKRLRNKGLPVYFTINTGQDVHLIVEKDNIKTLVERLKEVKEIKDIIVNFPSTGARIVNYHLF